ncbi:unnamed protein product [Phyllotreta striolata]|uniref:Uncharacterized protein n=1 Tax=Phyllotreta striolata TaxID=444603 RepID=A0A9N9TE97_PHYSR|nr:unnamed protein product [Phyllotreta striolata]
MCCKREDRKEVTTTTRITIFAIFLCHAFHATQSQDCPPESSNVLHQNTTVAWISSDKDSEIVTSNPPCTDEQGRLIVRLCSSGLWYPQQAQDCAKITTSRRCPLNFEETADDCLFVSAHRPWGNICNFESLLEQSAPAALENELVWMPYRRYIAYGPYEAVEWGSKRSKKFNNRLKGNLADPDFFNKNCLIADTATNDYFPEFCSNKHRHVCSFDKNEADSKCPDHCVNADVAKKTCFCKEKNYCSTTLSKIETILDYTVLKKLAGDNVCYVDSNLPVQQNKFQAISEDRWFYTDNDKIKCSLCTIINNNLKENNQSAEMVLNFDEKQKKLFLTIYSPQNLFNNANENTIYCYTDASQYELKKRLNVDRIIRNRKAGRPYNVYKVSIEKFIGDYWCEAYSDTNENNAVYSNTVLAYKKKPGNEFALKLKVISICIIFPCDEMTEFNYESMVRRTELANLKSQIRVMSVINFDFESIDLLLHITTEEKIPIVDDRSRIWQELLNLSNIEIQSFASSEFCLPETSENLTWPLTAVGQGAVADELCLQANGLPVVRICNGNFLEGATWGEVIGECHKDIQVPDTAKTIQTAMTQILDETTVRNVSNVIKTNTDLPVLSVYMVSKFMKHMYIQNSSVDVVNGTLEIADSMLFVNKAYIWYAQQLLNVSDDFIDLVENVLTDAKLRSNATLIQKSNLIMRIVNPLTTNVSGMVVYQDEENNVRMEDLPRNSTFDDVGDNALIAVIVPEDVINHPNITNLTIVTTVYFKDSFFESNSSRKPSGPVMSVSIPEFDGYLPAPIQILFRFSNYSHRPDCGFWDYGKKTVRKQGKWSSVGGNYLGELVNRSYYHVCSFSHLTHFSLLRLTLPQETLTSFDDQAMDVIFYLGDFLTIFGVAGIFVTAIMFRRWRRKQGTIILLNLSISILMEVFLMQATDTRLITVPQGCGVLGIMLHYIIISKFCWMLVYSFLQYMRFVRVLTVLPDNIVFKSVIFGWGFALIPVGIVNLVTTTAYSNKKYNFCYPTGLYLYLGTLLPVLLIICINTFVFIAVMREVTFKNVESHGSKENIHKLQVQLAILLFFVLGVPWLFFILANIIPVPWIEVALAYLFCVTSNVQGFILFLFYVVFNGETRLAWLTYFKLKSSKSFSVATKTTSRASKS